MEGPAGNSAGHIDSSGFFLPVQLSFPQKRSETAAGDDCSALTGDCVCSYTPDYSHTSTLVAGVGLWCTWDAVQHRRTHQWEYGGDGGAAWSISTTSWAWICNTFISVCHCHDWLVKWLLCALQACKKKNPFFKRWCAVLYYIATTQRQPELPPHIFEHMCTEMNYLPPDQGQSMREPVPASYSDEPTT